VETVSEAEREIRFQRLAHEVGAPVRRYVVRRAPAAMVDDVLADAFLVLWRRLDDVPTDDPVPWAIGVARGCLANAQRSARRQLSLIERIGRMDAPGPAPDRDEYPELLAALDTLPAVDREVVLLWAWEELAPREIAVVTGLTANAVSIRLHRAKRRLAAELERKIASAAGQEPDDGRRR
jgi:RNA polymerase sigma-70 factor (ECF subfamily)